MTATEDDSVLQACPHSFSWKNHAGWAVHQLLDRFSLIHVDRLPSRFQTALCDAYECVEFGFPCGDCEVARMDSLADYDEAE